MADPFFFDLTHHGLTGEWLGGVFGADGSRVLLFDVDGTRQGVRQRAVPTGAAHPPVHRRSGAATAPGHRGRKRAEAVRTRLTVEQRHTGEWLGTFGAPGNGDAFGMLDRACQVLVVYLVARGLAPSCGVVRLDGEQGWAHFVARLRSYGLGYLVRCCDYAILDDPALRAALAAGAIARVRHDDTGIERELFDVVYRWGSLRAAEQPTRLVVARRRVAPGEAVAVGKLRDGWVYEFIATSEPAARWDAAQVFTLYQGRGAFERALGDEDRELPTDRWVSFHPQGEEFWQILCQWVANLRVRASARARSVPPSREPLAPEAHAWRGEAVVLTPPAAATPTAGGEVGAVPGAASHDAPTSPVPTASSPPPPEAPPPSVPPSPVPPSPDAPPPDATQARLEAAGFRRVDARTVHCPTGVAMHSDERVASRTGPRIRYAAPASQCARCPQSLACRGHTRPTGHGRRITLPVWPDPSAPSPPTPPSREAVAPPRVAPPTSPPRFGTRPKQASQPATWEATWQPTALTAAYVAASALRRDLREALHGHRIEIVWASDTAEPPPVSARDRRGHRRRTWLQVWARNTLRGRPCELRLAGIPPELARVLGLKTVPDG